jgi:glycine oxidase
VAVAAQRAGATLEAGTVEQVIVEGQHARGVRLKDGALLEADAVVLAAGAWSSLVPGAGLGAQAVVPARGQMVQLQLPPGTLSHVLFTGRGYLVPRRDGRVLAGSTLEFVGFEKQVTVEGLRSILALAVDAVPALAQATISAQWAGFRPYTADGLPLLGEGPTQRLFFATGHHRNGILLAPITARIVADAVLGRPPMFGLGPFAPARSHA